MGCFFSGQSVAVLKKDTGASKVGTDTGNTVQDELNTIKGAVTSLETGLVGAGNETANATAISSLQTRMDGAEGSISAQALDISNLQTSMSSTENATTANGTAISTLESSVSLINGELASQASNITNLGADLTTAEGNIAAVSSSVGGLSTRVTAAEGSISSQASDIASLQTAMTNTETATSANATAMGGLDARLYAAESGITSQASDITNLQASVSNNTSSNTANANAISGIDTRVTAAESAITAQASDITALQTSVNGNESSLTVAAQSINGLEARFEVQASVGDIVGSFGLYTNQGQSTFYSKVPAQFQSSYCFGRSTADDMVAQSKGYRLNRGRGGYSNFKGTYTCLITKSIDLSILTDGTGVRNRAVVVEGLIYGSAQDSGDNNYLLEVGLGSPGDKMFGVIVDWRAFDSSDTESDGALYNLLGPGSAYEGTHNLVEVAFTGVTRAKVNDSGGQVAAGDNLTFDVAQQGFLRKASGAETVVAVALTSAINAGKQSIAVRLIN